MDVLAALAGDWQLSRVVTDHLTGETLALSGRASFRPDGAGLAYEESGHWTGGALQGMTGRQSYLWRAAPGRIEVLFPDGRLFHALGLPLQDGAEILHDCAPDTYRGAYAFDLPGGFVQHWRVTGPRKDYLSRSDFRRA